MCGNPIGVPSIPPHPAPSLPSGPICDTPVDVSNVPSFLSLISNLQSGQRWHPRAGFPLLSFRVS